MEDLVTVTEERHSVSEIVRNFSDATSEGHGKRDRSESGDPAPSGKRGARERDSEPSSSPRNSNLKQYLDAALEKLEDRLTSSISKDLHEFRGLISTELGALNDRVRDLERHVEERDGEIAELTSELAAVKKDVKHLQDRAENSEMNSRIPCLILSGKAMAPRRSQRLDSPLPPAARAAPPGSTPAGLAGRAQPADARPAVSGMDEGSLDWKLGLIIRNRRAAVRHFYR